MSEERATHDAGRVLDLPEEQQIAVCERQVTRGPVSPEFGPAAASLPATRLDPAAERALKQ